MTTPDKASLARVHDRLFGHRRYGSALHGPIVEFYDESADVTKEQMDYILDRNSADEFCAAPYYGKPTA